MNLLKLHATKYAWTITFFALACQDNEVKAPLTPSEAKFDQQEKVISENSPRTAISVVLDKPAKRNSTLVLTVSSSFENEFSTYPPANNGQITLAVTAGSSVATVDIEPVDDLDISGVRDVWFELTAASDGLTIGTQKKTRVVIIDDEGPVHAHFNSAEGWVRENEQEGSVVTIRLSSPAATEGELTVSFSGEDIQYGETFVTEPLSRDGALVLPVSAGASSLVFKVIPVNDAKTYGHKLIAFTLSASGGAVVVGDGSEHKLTLVDDELASKNKAYHSVAGHWQMKEDYQYDEDGKLSSVNWVSHTPAMKTGTDVYVYNTESKLVKVVKDATGSAMEIVYSWSGNRIVKSEQKKNGTVESFIDYDYDVRGNVAATAHYYRQPDGQFRRTFVHLYLYHLDGNIYKELRYIDQDDGEHALSSTRTYEGYLAKSNPFPMVDILPTVNAQPNLPTSFRIEEHGVDLQYSLSYEFTEEGLPKKRYVSGAGSEWTVYEYY